MIPTDWSIPEAGEALRSRTVSATELIESCLQRIAQRDPVISAFAHVAARCALPAASRADAKLAAGIDRGPLHGIPFAVKDLIDIADMPTECGSRLRMNRIAHGSATLVQRLLDAGAVPVGKTTTCEFALTGPSMDGPRQPAIRAIPHM
jgi:Asp-tRNA(Asn)/Glu-tRNA(Gln) amidotransferase A subunit family amidase